MRSFATSKLATRSVIALSSSFASFAPVLPPARRSTIAASARRWPSVRAMSRASATVSPVASTATVAAKGIGILRPARPASPRRSASSDAAAPTTGQPPHALTAGRRRHQRQGHCKLIARSPRSRIFAAPRRMPTAVIAQFSRGRHRQQAPGAPLRRHIPAIDAEAPWHGSRSAF